MNRPLITSVLAAAFLAVAGLLAALVSTPAALSATKVRVGKVTAAPQVIRAQTRGRITYLLSASATVSVTLQRQRTGRYTRRTGCGAPSSANRRGQPCTYFGGVAARRTARGSRGTNRMTLRKRFAGRTLSRGFYRVTVRARNGSQRQAAFSVR